MLQDKCLQLVNKAHLTSSSSLEELSVDFLFPIGLDGASALLSVLLAEPTSGFLAIYAAVDASTFLCTKGVELRVSMTAFSNSTQSRKQILTISFHSK